MNGIFSASPSPRAIRLVVAGLLLGCAQPAILLSAPEGTALPRSLIFVLALLALGALIGAVIGEGPSEPKGRWRRRRGT